VTVELSFSDWLLLQLIFSHRFPPALIDAIGEQKNHIHASLSPDPKNRYGLVGSAVFKLNNGDRFQVSFVSDRRQPSAEIQPLRVTFIKKL
jgi:hypothetical protein